MRQPTPRAELFAWWEAAIAGKTPTIYMDEPRCGYFRRRLVRGGPWVPVAIWMEQPLDEDGELIGPEIMRAAVNGKAADPVDIWSYVAGEPITLEEYRHLVRTAKWAQEHAPGAPEARPSKAIDLLRVEPPRF